MDTLRQRAETLLELHQQPKLLVLPNIWDPLGALVLRSEGFPAVATASAAVAFALGYDDGERLRFSTMLEVIRRIAAAVDVPVTADIEGGYADAPDDVAANMREVLRAGAVGINLEDSRADGTLRRIRDQVARLQAVRAMANEQDVPLVINARIDTYATATEGADPLPQTIDRAAAYLEAGADCIYPIGLDDLDALARLRGETGALLNVYAGSTTRPPNELEAAGISRLSFGPVVLRAWFTQLRGIARELHHGRDYDGPTRAAASSDEIRKILLTGTEPQPPS